MVVYHLCTLQSWNSQKLNDIYVHDSLESEGFIHCSFENQVEGVLDRYFEGVTEILQFTIDTELLSSDFVIEASTGDEDFPHIYGVIDKVAIVDIIKLR